MKDPNCIFCKIINKEIPAEIVYEDELFVALMDIRPLSPGHALVIPKDHHRWVWDVPDVGKYFEIVRKVALAQRKAFGIDKVESKIVGEEIPHAHIWVFPDPVNTKGNKMDFKGNAEKIRLQLK